MPTWTQPHPDALSPNHAAVLAAVATQAFPTVRSVAKETGLSVGATHRALCGLRERSYVTWQPHHSGTLRPTVTVDEPTHRQDPVT